jgi:hypothetical protein
VQTFAEMNEGDLAAIAGGTPNDNTTEAANAMLAAAATAMAATPS